MKSLMLKCDRCGAQPGLLYPINDKATREVYRYCYPCLKKIERKLGRRLPAVDRIVYEEGVSMR